MLRIAVLDDETVCIARIRQITNECMSRIGMKYEIHEYKNGQDILDDLEKEKYFDIYLLDVELPGINGLEIAKQIRRKYTDPVLIYITNYVDYAVEAFEVNTYRYIPKRMLDDKLPQAYLAMEPLLKKKKYYDQFYLIEKYGQQKKVFYRDIYYLKKDRKYVILVHKGGIDQVRISIGEILAELQSEKFLLIDRGYIVNIDYVQSIKDYQVYVQNGEVLPVSKPQWPHVRAAIINGGV